MAAAFSFFSAMRFAIRALKRTLNTSSSEKKVRDILVLRLLLLLVFESAKLKGTEMSAALETQRGNQSLDLWAANVVHISSL
jgi:hypothetical protein